jgi:hypothetical protein
MMEAMLPGSQYGKELAARRQTLRFSAAALGRVLLAALQRVVLQQREVPAEFFRYPLP